MPTSDQNMLDAVRTFVEGANKGRVEESIWNLIAEPETFVFAEAFGAAFGKAECGRVMQQWVSDKGLRMELAETRVKRNHFPGIHEVEADVTFKFPQPAFEGLPTEIPGAVYFTFNDDGKLLRVQNTVAGPRAEELEQTMAMAVIASQGGKVEGQDMAAVAIKDVAERIATNDPARFAERMTDGAILIDPVTVHIGKPAIMAAMARWFGAGMRKADPAHDPVSMIPYRAMAKINYDFSGLPSEAPVAKTTQGTVIVDVEPGSGLIMRIAALPHEESNRKWSSDLVNWLVQQQIKQAQQAA